MGEGGYETSDGHHATGREATARSGDLVRPWRAGWRRSSTRPGRPIHILWIADASDGTLLGMIEGTEGIHWVAVDPSGNVYAASNRSHYLRKYSKVGATN